MNMMKSKIILIPMVIFCLLLTCVPCAIAEFAVEKDVEHCDIIISDLPASSQVLVVDFLADDILKDGKRFSELSNEEKLTAVNDHLVYVRQITANEHTLRVPHYGRYTIMVHNGSSISTEEVVLIDPGFVTDYTTASDEDAFVTLFEESEPFMRVEIPSFYALTESEQETVAKRLFPKRADQTEISAIKEKVELYTKLQNLITESNTATVVLDFEALSEEIAFEDFTKKEAYTRGSVDFKADVIKRFAAYKADDKSEFDDAFTKSVLLEQVESAISTQVIGQIAGEIETTFGISSSNYKALGNNTLEVDNEVKGQNYNTIEDFVAALQAKSTTDTGGDSGDSSSGGSSSPNRKPSQNISVTINEGTSVSGQNGVENIAFYDVPEDRWSYDSIVALKKMNVLTGDGNGYFRPEDNVTRAEFIKIAVVAFEMTYANAQSSFSDVNISEWFYPYISSANHFGIVNGKSDTHFAPKDNITREEAAVIAYNIVSFKQMPIKLVRDGAEFADKDGISPWADEAVNYLYRCNIINGMGENNFAPKNTMTREQAAKLIFGLLSVE